MRITQRTKEWPGRRGPCSSTEERGSVLAASLMLCLLLGVTLATYLMIARSEHFGAAYTYSWHKTLTMAEAGVEEGLAQINGAGLSSMGSAVISSNWIHREFDGGAYDVQILPGPGASAIIYSTGYVTIPAWTNVITRSVVVQTTNAPLFSASVAALTNISMSSKSKNVTFSAGFDSANPNAGTNSHSLVACLAGSLSIGSSKLLGDLLLGPTASAGAAQASGNIFHNFNTDFPDVVAPPSNWLPAAFAHQTIDGTDYTYVFNNQGEYTINSDGAIYVAQDANICLQIQSANFTASSIYVAGTNRHAGKLVIYALQPNVTFGDVTVESLKPANLVYLGASGNTSLTLNNDSDLKFFGTIYAPSASLIYNVGGNGKTKKASFYGSCMARTVQVNGTASFYFDEDLLRNSPVSRGQVITSWKEL